jgi:ATP-dependent Lhr-like helicase
VHAPWAIVLGARLRERYGVDAAAMHSDDGIVLRLPDMVDAAAAFTDPWGGADAGAEDDGAPLIDAADLLVDADEVLDAVRAELGSSAMFGARFREAASRALLLPRRRPDRRQPLWQQRQRSAQLLSVAAQYPDFPILLEAVRECLQDDFDTDGLAALMRDVAQGRVRVVEVTTPQPSPFARSLLFGYTAQFLYDGDAPLAERRAAALTLDPTLLAELLGEGGASQLADLLDPDAVLRTEAEISGRAPDRQAGSLEQLADAVRRQGPLTQDELAERVRPELRGEVAGWLDELERARRVIRVRLSGVPAERTVQWAAIEDAGRLRDALGVALPVGVPEVFTEVLPDPVGDLLRRHARTHGPFTAASAAARFGWGVAVVSEALGRLEAIGVLVQGRLRPEVLGGTGDEYCDADVLRTLRRRSLAALRAEVEPVPPAALGVFLPRWQGVHPAGTSSATGLRGVDGVARAVEQLAGAVVPASALETHVLPARVKDYSPAMLDELTAAGEVLWAGHGRLAGQDGLVSLHPAAVADLTLPVRPPEDEATATPLHRAVLTALDGGGAWFLAALTERVRFHLATEALGAEDEPAPGDAPAVSQGDVVDALWDLVWAGAVTNDGLAPLRAWLGARRTAHRTPTAAPRGRAVRPRLGLRALGGVALRAGGPTVPTGPASSGGGRWSLLPARELDPTLRAHALAAQLLDRHGVLTRAVAPSENLGGRFADVYRVLAALEEAGQVRRGYFVERLGGTQFALPGAVDRLRTDAQVVQGAAQRAQDGVDPLDPHVVVLAATDPANPYGAALAWPAAPTGEDGDAGAVRHRPGRKAGALVVLVDGALALYLERGGRSALSFTRDPHVLAAAARGLVATAGERHLGRLTVARVDGLQVLGEGGLHSPLGEALTAAGFATTPRGLRFGSAGRAGTARSEASRPEHGGPVPRA